MSTHDIAGLPIDTLEALWAGRRSRLADLATAMTLLARLRHLRGVDRTPLTPSQLQEHPEILRLRNYLPESQPPAPADQPPSLTSPDTRTRVTRAQVARPHQVDFRQRLLDRYGARCAITGVTAHQALDAAHVVPYRGEHSDHTLNGLLLRADIHRLFDRHLLSIDPRTLTIVVHPDVRDPAYRSLDGKPLRTGIFKPGIGYIKAHYDRYLETLPQTN